MVSVTSFDFTIDAMTESYRQSCPDPDIPTEFSPVLRRPASWPGAPSDGSDAAGPSATRTGQRNAPSVVG